MQLATAVKLLQKECQFLGLKFTDLLQDIQKYGKMVYGEKTMQAYRVYLDAQI
jgi:hypothetical protein